MTEPILTCNSSFRLVANNLVDVKKLTHALRVCYLTLTLLSPRQNTHCVIFFCIWLNYVRDGASELVRQ